MCPYYFLHISIPRSFFLSRMCIVRLSSEGREGFIIRNNMMKNLWEDVDKRSKKLGVICKFNSFNEFV